MTFAEWIEKRRIIICVGSGGAGKTTTASVIALAAARAGKKTLVVTIDPAKRLAQALGLAHLTDKPQRVSVGDQEQSLHFDAMMLDQKKAFDEILLRSVENKASQDKLLASAIYEQISSRLTGAYEYAAVSKLYDLWTQGNYDTIVLDTPPSSEAVLFLEAPERISESLDSTAATWFRKAYQAAGRVSRSSLGLGASFFLGRIARFLGWNLIDEMGGFLVEGDALLGEFRKRAAIMSRLLRQPEVGFALITSPVQDAINESVDFVRFLRTRDYALDAAIVNRMTPLSLIDTSTSSADTLKEVELSLGADAVGSVGKQFLAEFSVHQTRLIEQATYERDAVAQLKKEAGERSAWILVPDLWSDDLDRQGLVGLAERWPAIFAGETLSVAAAPRS